MSVTLYQMIDLALGTPEIGAVNFNVLRMFLQDLLKTLKITDIVSHNSDKLKRLKSVLKETMKSPSFDRSPKGEKTRSSKSIDQGERKDSKEEKERRATKAGRQRKQTKEEKERRETKEERQRKETKEEREQRHKEDKKGSGFILHAENEEGTLSRSSLLSSDAETRDLEDKVHRPESQLEIHESSSYEELEGSVLESMSDTWGNLELGKRVEANEESIKKVKKK